MPKQFTFAWDTTGEPDGPVTVTAEGLDESNNVLATQDRPFEIDNTDPEPGPDPEPVGKGVGVFATLLNGQHVPVGFIESFTSFSWTQSLWGAGSARLSLPRQSRWANVIGNEWVLIPPDDSDLAYVVRQMVLDIEGATGGALDITAPGIGTVLDNPGRVVIPVSGSHDEQNDVPAETAMKHYVDGHAGANAITTRQLPKFTVAANQARGANVTYHARFESVKEVIADIGRAGGLGWDVTYDRENDEFVFDVVAGVDRTDEVFFDLDFESVLSMEWLRSQMNRATLAYVAGAGEGETRMLETVWIADTEPSGFHRHEVFLNQGGVDTAAALQEVGKAHLEAHRSEDTIEVQINPRGSFRYGRDFDLGDVVTVRNTEFGFSSESRIVEVTSTIQSPSLEPEIVVALGNPWPTVQLRIEEELKQQRSKPR